MKTLGDRLLGKAGHERLVELTRLDSTESTTRAEDNAWLPCAMASSSDPR